MKYLYQALQYNRIYFGSAGFNMLYDSGRNSVNCFFRNKTRKPILIEGLGSVCKTLLAKAIAKFYKFPSIRLKCYEDLDEPKALYDLKNRKQLLKGKLYKIFKKYIKIEKL
jgi:hypothetical protein